MCERLSFRTGVSWTSGTCKQSDRIFFKLVLYFLKNIFYLFFDSFTHAYNVSWSCLAPAPSLPSLSSQTSLTMPRLTCVSSLCSVTHWVSRCLLGCWLDLLQVTISVLKLGKAGPRRVQKTVFHCDCPIAWLSPTPHPCVLLLCLEGVCRNAWFWDEHSVVTNSLHIYQLGVSALLNLDLTYVSISSIQAKAAAPIGGSLTLGKHAETTWHLLKLLLGAKFGPLPALGNGDRKIMSSKPA